MMRRCLLVRMFEQRFTSIVMYASDRVKDCLQFSLFNKAERLWNLESGENWFSYEQGHFISFLK